MSAASATGPIRRWAPLTAAVSWTALIVLCLAWETVLAPLRPGGSWLVLKCVPLLFTARGVVLTRPKAMQWSLLLVTLYAAEGVIRLGEPPPHSWLAAAELLLAAVFYVAAIIHLHPLKKAARRARGRDA